MTDSAGIIDSLTSFLRENLFIAILACIGLIFLIYGMSGLLAPSTAEEAIVLSESDAVSADISVVTVDVSGAVNRPGVYTLPSDARVNEALEKAGGLSDQANHALVSQTINLAKPLTDGEKIYVPLVSDNAQSSVLATETGKISINAGTSTDLDSLPGVGVVTAQKIIDGRPYSSIDELLSKKVVGQSVFEKIREQISL